MPEDKKCTLHPSLHAVGTCNRCKRPFCLDCLDMETGQILCVECKSGKYVAPPASTPAPSAPAPIPAPVPPPSPIPMAKPAASAPVPPGMAGSPLNFKGKGLDDDILGLLGGSPAPSAPKVEAPKPNLLPPIAPKPISTPPVLGGTAPTLNMNELGVRSAAPPSTSKGGLDLDDLMGGVSPSLPKIPSPAPSFKPLEMSPAPSLPLKPFEGAPVISPFPAGSMPGIAVGPANKKKQVFSLVKTWAKYLVKQAYYIFDPIAKKLKVPVYVLLGGSGLVLFLLIVGLISLIDRPVIALAKMVPTIYVVKVSSNDVSEMDVTAYSDLQNKLQSLGFSPLIQMTVPQLPSPNYFDVGIKEDVGAYSEILKLPGQIAPHLSFVTVFTNGTWCSTNAWQGKSQELEYLDSEYDPNLSPDQLYVKHIQRVEKLKKDQDLQVQAMNENRYISALTDRLRWFLVRKDMQGYQADFNLWH